MDHTKENIDRAAGKLVVIIKSCKTKMQLEQARKLQLAWHSQYRYIVKKELPMKEFINWIDGYTIGLIFGKLEAFYMNAHEGHKEKIAVLTVNKN